MPSHSITSRRRRSTTVSPQSAPSTIAQKLETGPHRVVTMCWSPSGHYLAVALQHGTILIFATQPSTSAPLRPIPIRVLKGHSADVVHLAFSPSNLLASASIDRSVRLWQPATGLCLRRLSHADKVVASAFDPADPAVLLTATANGQVRLVRVSDRTILSRTDTKSPIHSVAMLPTQGAKSSAILTTRDGRVLEWRPQTAVEMPTHQLLEIAFETRRSHALVRRSHKEIVAPTSVAQLPGGRVLLTSGARRAELAAVSGLSRRVRAGALPVPGQPLATGMSPDGRFSLVDAAGGSVRMLDGAAQKRSHGSTREVVGGTFEVSVFNHATVSCAAFATETVLKRTARRGAQSSFLLAVGASDRSIAIVQQSY